MRERQTEKIEKRGMKEKRKRKKKGRMGKRQEGRKEKEEKERRNGKKKGKKEEWKEGKEKMNLCARETMPFQRTEHRPGGNPFLLGLLFSKPAQFL